MVAPRRRWWWRCRDEACAPTVSLPLCLRTCTARARLASKYGRQAHGSGMCSARTFTTRKVKVVPKAQARFSSFFLAPAFPKKQQQNEGSHRHAGVREWHVQPYTVCNTRTLLQAHHHTASVRWLLAVHTSYSVSMTSSITRCGQPSHFKRTGNCVDAPHTVQVHNRHDANFQSADVPCTVRMLNNSIEHEDGSNATGCRSNGGSIDASRRRLTERGMDAPRPTARLGAARRYKRDLRVQIPWGAAPNTFPLPPSFVPAVTNLWLV